MINYNDIGAWHFASELDVVEVTTAEEVTVRITDSVGTELLESRYIPTEGVVRVYHLHKLLSPLISGVTADFTLTVGAESKLVHVVQSRVEVAEGAATFLSAFFLSTVMSERDTAIGRKELLTLLPIEAAVPAVRAECRYRDGAEVVTETKTLATGLATGEVAEVDVSPARLVDAKLGTLLGYTVRCGSRRMSYRVASLPTEEVAMLMRNAFGAWEAVTLQG